MGYGQLADLVVAFHVGYVSYVVFGQLVIFAGLFLRWQWVRNPWFRWSHVLMISIVVLESIGNVQCPLTTWEYQLRHLAGQRLDERLDPEMVAASLIGHLAQLEAGPLCAANLVTREKFYRATFIGQVLHDVLFLELDFDHWGFAAAYVSFALLVIGTMWLAPPRSFRRRQEKYVEWACVGA